MSNKANDIDLEKMVMRKLRWKWALYVANGNSMGQSNFDLWGLIIEINRKIVLCEKQNSDFQFMGNQHTFCGEIFKVKLLSMVFLYRDKLALEFLFLVLNKI